MSEIRKATKQEAMDLCKKIYDSMSGIGFYPALTGGLLYKDGDRKDIDIVIYRNRQNVQKFELKDLEEPLSKLGLIDFNHYGFVSKCKWNGITVDLFNPESENLSEDEYNNIISQP